MPEPETTQPNSLESSQTPGSFPNLDTLLHDPANLSNLLHNPAIFMDKLRGEGGNDFDEATANQYILETRNQALFSIVGPEGMVNRCKKSAENVSETAGDLVLRTTRFLDEASDEIAKGTKTLKNSEEMLHRAKTAVNYLRNIVEGNSPFNIEEARIYLVRLRDFHEEYSSSYRMLTVANEDGAGKIRAARVSSEEGVVLTQTTSRNMRTYRETAQNNPESLYFDGVVEAVAQRAAGSSEAHKASCESQTTQYEQFNNTMFRGFENLSEHLRNIGAKLQRQEFLELLPTPTRFGDAVDYLSSSMYRFEQHGNVMSRSIIEAYTEVETILRRIESGMSDVVTNNAKDSQEIQLAKDSVRTLRTALQEI